MSEPIIVEDDHSQVSVHLLPNGRLRVEIARKGGAKPSLQVVEKLGNLAVVAGDNSEMVVVADRVRPAVEVVGHG